MGGTIDGSYSANGNTLILNNCQLANLDVFGGYGESATNNTVVLRNSSVKGVSNKRPASDGDTITGNVLNLYGENSIVQGAVCLETINIKEAKWGTPALKALNANGIIWNYADHELPTISTEGITFTGIDVPWSMEAGNSTNLIEAAGGIIAKLDSGANISHKYTINSTNVENFVTGVEVEAAINGSVDFNVSVKI